MSQPTKRVDMGTIQKRLDSLAQTLIEQIKMDWPGKFAHLPLAQQFCRFTLGYCLTAFRAECAMFTDERREAYNWRWDGVALLPAANRTLLDCLFNVIFLLEDIEPRVIWFHKSGWREQRVEYTRWREEYQEDSEWQDWLNGLAEIIDRGVREFSVTQAELANPKLIKQWPSSGQMPDYEVNPSTRPPARQFLHYLSDWFYKSYSGQAHMSFLGILKLGAVIAIEDMDKEQREKLRGDGIPRLMTSHLALSITLLLCVISEIQNYFKFQPDIELRILAIWHALIPDFADAKDIFEKRYSLLFPALLIGGPAKAIEAV